MTTSTAAESTPGTPTATTMDDLHADILTQILLHLDGPSLAAAICADSRLGSLASERTLWDRLCLSAFPSLSVRPALLDDVIGTAPRRFFSRAFPFPASSSSSLSTSLHASSPPAPRLVSAVDLYHRGELIYSTIVDTETQSQWFLSAPFRIDALERCHGDAEGAGISPNHSSHQHHTTTSNTTPSSPASIHPEDLSLNWVLIDPAARDAANLSSRRPVAIDRHWYTGETQVRFATVLASAAAAATATVTLGAARPAAQHGHPAAAHVLEISLSVEDGAEGACLNGRQSLEVLCGATRGGRESLSNEGEARAVARYREFDRKKRERKESKAAREGKLDLCCAMLGASLLLSSVAVVAFGW